MTSTLNNSAKTPETNSTTAQEEVYIFPASFAQQRLWFLSQLAPGNPFYNVPAAIRLNGSLNLAALKQTFNEIVRRHETLRTTFAVVDDQLCQVIAPVLDLPIEVINLQATPVHQQDLTAIQLATSVARQPFDLTRDALLRVKLFKFSETHHILLLVLHHIVADGWSIGVLIRELSVLYSAFSLGNASPLSELSIQYADFSHWQREWLQGDVLEEQLTYWRSQLQNLSVLNLRSDRPMNAEIPSYQGGSLPINFSRHLTDSLEALSQQSDASLFMLLLAAFQTLLYRYTGETDIAVGSPIANRNQSELEGLIGFFVNSLVLRTDLSGNPTFRELLVRVREVTLSAYAHQDLPFELLVQDLHPQRDLSRNPLFQVAIALQNTPIDALELPGLRLERVEIDLGTARLDLEVNFWRSSNGLQGQITYSTELFEQPTIARLLEHFQILLEGIVAQPEQSLATLPLLSAAACHQLSAWNQTWQDYPNYLCIHHLFESQVQQTPDAIAVVDGDEQVTYQELNQRSNQLAHYLQHFGVGPDVLVGICLDRSINLIVSVLGVLKAGGAYVPLDPTYPQERLEFILKDTQIAILVTQEKNLPPISPILEGFSTAQNFIKHVCLDRDHKSITAQSHQNPINSVTRSNLAYVIYTSGSTGQPKGVLIEHRGLVNLAYAQQQTFALQSPDRVLQFASLSFDASIFEIVMAFQAGATLYIAKAESRLGTALYAFLRDNAITTVTLPPSVLKLLPVENLSNLHTIISAGEACSSDVAARWMQDSSCPQRRFFNAYGPTEATVWSTIAEIHDFHAKPSLGRAIANTQLYVLDTNLQPVPIGIPGELYIGGDGLARGYLNRLELTEERFITTPHSLHPTPHPPPLTPHSRLYKTGDRVRYLSNGTLEFLGRLDDQVKIRGYRIELGEIEATLAHHPAIQQVAVVSQDSAEHQQLVAYVVLNSNRSLTYYELRQVLQQKLPAYYVPSALVIVEFLPLTPSGKIDRAALKAIRPAKDNSNHSIDLPQTATEQVLATLWSQLLNHEQVGRNSNFFELGGDSLLAMRLLHMIQQRFHQDLPLSTLFLTPTIAQLAPLLEQPAENTPQVISLQWSPLVPLQTAGAKQPFFCVHPIFGVVFPYLELARQLGSDRPFYGLQSAGLHPNQTPYTRIEEMAADYIQAIQQVQPEGPYLIGGWSFGGLVAFEMAQQLQQAGHEIGLLALLDTIAPIPSNQPSLLDGVKFLLTTVTRSIAPFLLDYVALLLSSSSTKKQSWRFRLQQAAIANLISEESNLKLLNELAILSMLRVFYANSQAAHRYVAKAYSDKITLFQTAQSVGKRQNLTLGWSELTDTIVAHSVPGNHLSMLKHPHVQTLTKQLRNCLEQI